MATRQYVKFTLTDEDGVANTGMQACIVGGRSIKGPDKLAEHIKKANFPKRNVKISNARPINDAEGRKAVANASDSKIRTLFEIMDAAEAEAREKLRRRTAESQSVNDAKETPLK